MNHTLLLTIALSACAARMDIPRDDAGYPVTCEGWVTHPPLQHEVPLFYNCNGDDTCNSGMNSEWRCFGGSFQGTQCAPGMCTKHCSDVNPCNNGLDGVRAVCYQGFCRLPCTTSVTCPSAQSCTDGVCQPSSCACP
jgi:hypothetical protein